MFISLLLFLTGCWFFLLSALGRAVKNCRPEHMSTSPTCCRESWSSHICCHLAQSGEHIRFHHFSKWQRWTPSQTAPQGAPLALLLDEASSIQGQRTHTMASLGPLRNAPDSHLIHVQETFIVLRVFSSTVDSSRGSSNLQALRSTLWCLSC